MFKQARTICGLCAGGFIFKIPYSIAAALKECPPTVYAAWKIRKKERGFQNIDHIEVVLIIDGNRTFCIKENSFKSLLGTP